MSMLAAPAMLCSELAHLRHPLLEVYACNMRSLQLETKSNAELENFDDRLFSEFLNLNFLDLVAFVRTADHF
jgi:hypothetical protein